MVIQFFVPHPISQTLYNEARRWFIIIASFTLILGLESLTRLHVNRVRRRQSGWGYSIITLVSLVFTAVTGVIWGIGEGSLFMRIYRYIYAPLQATMFSMLAFYMASAAYRSFRARTPEAVLLLVSALFMMFGRVPIGDLVFAHTSEVIEWILQYPSMAVQRGILLGVGLGIIATSLKIILGVERNWLGGT